VKRALAFVLVVIVSVTSGVVFAWLGRGRAPVVTSDQLSALHQAEEAHATAAGLAVIDHGVTTSELEFVRDVPLTTGDCLAVVASVAGPVPLQETSIVLNSGRVTRIDIVGTRVAHRAICAVQAGTATVSVRPDRSEAPYAPSELRFTILRGRVPRPRQYTQLDVSPEERSQFDIAAVRARVYQGRNDRELEPAQDMSRATALLVPASSATFAALRALVGRPGVVPATDPTSADQDPFRQPSETTIPPRVLAERGPVRVLAVVDAGAIAARHHVGCVRVVLARLDEPSTRVPVTRIAVPSQVETPLVFWDEAIAVDEVCEASGPFVYVTDEDAGGDYVLSLRAQEGPTTGTLSPSTFGAPSRRGPPTVERLPVIAVVRARAGCESGNAADCRRWVDLALAGLDGAGDPSVPLERTCSLEGGLSCDQLAALLETRNEALRAERFERRACETGLATACLRRAARFRESGRFEEAYRTYRYGCSHACGECCGAASTMEEWLLARRVLAVDTPP